MYLFPFHTSLLIHHMLLRHFPLNILSHLEPKVQLIIISDDDVSAFVIYAKIFDVISIAVFMFYYVFVHGYVLCGFVIVMTVYNVFHCILQ